MSIFLYRIFLTLYQFGALLISPFNRKVRLWRAGRRFGLGHWATAVKAQQWTKDDFVIWMHAASLGEFEQGVPVLMALKSKYPESKVVVTFFSPSGYEVRKDFKGADIVGYLPFDHPVRSREFVHIIQPSVVLWIKYEYWYYTLKAIREWSATLLLVSGIFREDQPFFKKTGIIYRQMLQFFDHFFVQNQASCQLLQQLVNSSKITVSGDTRFDRVAEIAANWSSIPVVEAWLADATEVIVAGSTWPSDEEEMAHYFTTRKHLKLILAPHSVDEEMIHSAQMLFPGALLYSQLNKGTKEDELNTNGQVLIVDNIGMLSRLYKYATLCYVGGGFTGDGVHNVLEAAVYGKPVIHGPEFSKYSEAIDLLAAGGSTTIDSAIQFESTCNRLLTRREEIQKMGAASLAFVHSRKGASLAIVNYIQANRLDKSL